jgi:hypothetical protein
MTTQMYRIEDRIRYNRIALNGPSLCKEKAAQEFLGRPFALVLELLNHDGQLCGDGCSAGRRRSDGHGVRAGRGD